MTTEKHRKLQRGCHTFAIFFATFFFFATRTLEIVHNSSSGCQLEISCEQNTHYDGSFSQNCVVGFDGHAIRSILSRNVSKRPTCLATRNATFCCIADFKNGVLHVKSFLQLATQSLLRHKLQEKLPHVTWPIEPFFELTSRFKISEILSKKKNRIHT